MLSVLGCCLVYILVVVCVRKLLLSAYLLVILLAVDFDWFVNCWLGLAVLWWLFGYLFGLGLAMGLVAIGCMGCCLIRALFGVGLLVLAKLIVLVVVLWGFCLDGLFWWLL